MSEYLLTLKLPAGLYHQLEREGKEEQRTLEQQALFALVLGARLATSPLSWGTDRLHLVVSGPDYSRLTVEGDRAAIPALLAVLEGGSAGGA